MSGGRIPGSVLVAVGAALWGTTGTSQALLDGAVPPLAVGALRILVGGAALAVIALPGLRLAIPALRRAPGPLLVATLATAAYQPAFFTGVQQAGVAVGTIVTVGAAPFLAGTLSVVLGHHRPSRRWMAMTVLAVGGLALLVAPGFASSGSARGVLAALGAALSFAAYTVAAKRLLVRGVPHLAAVAAPFLLAGLLLAVMLPSALADAVDPGVLVTPAGLAVVGWLGLGATAAAYLLFTAGLRTVPAVTGTTLALAEPLTATALGVLLLGERLGPLGAAGAATIALALLMVARHPDRDPHAVPDLRHG